ncbi:MAG TPA: hypothetical protein VK540_34515 [Polyangiaceae bacterium]|nr:hypothetical protein [Polyangiaceae bacterium]
MKPGHSLDWKAEVLVDAMFTRDDEAVAKKHGISPRSIIRYREQMTKSRDLAELVAQKRAAIDDKIRDELVDLIRLSIEAAKVLVVKAKESGDPVHLHAVIGAVKIAKELKLDDDVLHGSGPKNRSNPKAASPSGTSGHGTGAGAGRPGTTVN